jgi:hypothetical protein
MKEIEFNGVKVQYDEKCLKSWKWHKALASGDDKRGTAAIERLLMDRDEEIADALGDDIDVMGELIGAIVADSGRVEKN